MAALFEESQKSSADLVSVSSAVHKALSGRPAIIADGMRPRNARQTLHGNLVGFRDGGDGAVGQCYWADF